MNAYRMAIAELGLDPDGPEVQLNEHLADQDEQLIANLVRLRERAGLTVDELARAWCVPVSVIEDFERPGSDPRLSTVRLYAAAIGARYLHRARLDAGIHPHLTEGEEP